MNVERPLDEAMARAALSIRSAKSELSAIEIRRIALYACAARDTLEHIRSAAEKAQAQGLALEPESLIKFIDEDIVTARETAHAEHHTSG